ncbi:hypothetical protein Tco_1440592 [Tanacetum coccineum]
MWRNKAELETMSMDDLYNNLKVYELEVKGMSSSSSSTQNMAFVSSSNNNSNSSNKAVNAAHRVTTASTQVNTTYSINIDNLSDVVICSFFASQPNSPQLTHEDLQQIHPDDIEEMDLRWQMAVLTMRVKKLEKKRSSRTHGLKRLYKVSLSARVESSGEEESLDEDASKQGRISDIDADKDITLVNVQDDAEMFNADVLDGEEVFVAEQEVVAKDVNLTVDEVTLAQALAALKSVKPKVKGDVIEEPSVPVSADSTSIKVSAATTKTATIPTPRKGIVITELGTPTIMRSSQHPSQEKVQDKGKGKFVEPERPVKKKDQISFDEETAKRLQAEFDEEERPAREKHEANVSLTET